METKHSADEAYKRAGLGIYLTFRLLASLRVHKKLDDRETVDIAKGLIGEMLDDPGVESAKRLFKQWFPDLSLD